jgi:hypothetical protein
MSEELSITDSILLNKVIDANVEHAAREVRELPFNHPSRISHDLDREIVEESSSFGVNTDVIKALGLIRQVQAQKVEGPQAISQAEAAEMLMNDLDAAINDAIEEHHPFDVKYPIR